MSTITVPTVIDALVAAFTAIPNTEVSDGPIPDPSGSDVIQVGVGDESVIYTTAHASGLGAAYNEQYHVVCMLWSRSGVRDMKPRRDRCGVMLDAVRGALIADKTLGGKCQWAELGPDLAWLQQYAGEGAACSVGFSVSVRATI